MGGAGGGDQGRPLPQPGAPQGRGTPVVSVLSGGQRSRRASPSLCELRGGPAGRSLAPPVSVPGSPGTVAWLQDPGLPRLRVAEESAAWAEAEASCPPGPAGRWEALVQGRRA